MTPPADISDHCRELDDMVAEGRAMMRACAERAPGMLRIDPAEARILMDQWSRLGRGVRQCMALKERFVRNQARDIRDADEHRLQADAAEATRRGDHLSNHFQRLVWTEAEAPDSAVEQQVEDLLDDAVADRSLAQGTIADQIESLREKLGLTVPAPSTPSGGRSRSQEPQIRNADERRSATNVTTLSRVDAWTEPDSS